jgi:hypothetical protein
MTDVACDKIIGIGFKGTEECCPVAGVPDIKFDEPVIIELPVQEIKPEYRKMAVMEYPKTINQRIGKLPEEIIRVNNYAALILSGKIFGPGDPAIEDEPDFR